MRNFAIIPARAGSKGIPGKNLKTLGGQTLTHRALHSANASGIFDKVILTTDIPILLEEETSLACRGPDQEFWVIHPRRAELATDQTPMSDVVLDVLDAHKIPDNAMIWLLQPTSPFRKPEDFTKILELFRLYSPGSVISVTSVGDSHPSRHYKLSTYQDLVPLFPKLASFDNRQSLKPVFERNGMYYVTKAGDYRRLKTFYVPKCKPYLVDRLYSFNINDEIDFKIAQAVSQWI